MRPGIKVRLDRQQRLKFPDDPDTFFFAWLTEAVHKKFGGYPMTPGVLDKIQEEVLHLLSIANDVYSLRTELSFWKLTLEGRDRTVELLLRPKSFGDEVVAVGHHPAGGFVAEIGDDFVRGPTKIEAIIGLGRLLEAKGRPAPIPALTMCVEESALDRIRWHVDRIEDHMTDCKFCGWGLPGPHAADCLWGRLIAIIDEESADG